MAYKLLIEAKTESRAKILGIRVRSLLEGQRYCVSFIVTNLGEQSFPSGTMDVALGHYESQLGSYITDIKLPEILPKESVEVGKGEGVISFRGTALFEIHKIQSSDKKEVFPFKHPQNPKKIDWGQAFSSIHATTSDEIYQFWAMVIAAISLSIIALEKIVQFFLWLYSIFPT